VRLDYKTGDLTSEINDGEGTTEQIRAQYQKDWDERPAEDGAPYTDINKDGKYEPSIDIPGVPGADQTIFYIANDLDSSKTKLLYGSPPVGLEVHVTVWGYENNNPPLGNMIFKKYQVINKSDSSYNDVYFGVWSDIDIGYAEDDVDGCDTLLNLGYTYNFLSEDIDYKPLPPPVVGFALLQGPVVEGSPSDTAVFNDKFLAGKKNLPMTSIGYIYKNNGFPENDPVQGNYEGSIYMYNLLQGRLENGDYIQVPDNLGGGTTVFPFSGNPVTGSGFLDTTPFDHRIMVNSGPFNLAPGDTQEVVFDEILAGAVDGVSNLNAVGLLKNYTLAVKYFYKKDFSLSLSMPPLKLHASGLNKEVVLTWGNNLNTVQRTENFKFANSRFEGYNIYQLPSDISSLKEGKRIATYDLIDSVGSFYGRYIDLHSGDIVTYGQFGSNSGIKRYLDLKEDYLTGKDLINGSKYYYAVAAYTYDPDPLFLTYSYETPSAIVTVVPQSAKPGVRYQGTYGEQINVTHALGSNDISVKAMVVDPAMLTGDTYTITFNSTANQFNRILTDSTKSEIKLQNQVLKPGIPANFLVDGMLVSLTLPADSVHINNSEDVFIYTAPGITNNLQTAKEDVENINVFPNPYYGQNPQETVSSQKFVTFSHLPKKAIIRIFNLAGIQVSVIYKDSPDQFQKWNLANKDGLLVGSGLYIAYINMPGLGVTKILKIAVIRSEGILH